MAGTVDPGDAVHYGDIIDKKTGLQVIGAVEDEIGALDEDFDGFVVSVGDKRLDVDLRVYATKLAGGGFGLGEVLGDIIFIEEHLSLEVAQLDEVAINELESAYPGTGEGFC